MTTATPDAGLVLAEIRTRARACGESADGIVPPVAILWTDPASQWRPAIDLLKQTLPELIELGPYEPTVRRGPAIWVRCVVDRTVEVEGLPTDRPPIVYLPGVARQQLRAGEDCPVALRPLVELLHRGTVWLHYGGHDHTVSAFLKSPKLLGLDVAEDAATHEAILRAVNAILQTSVADLSGRRLAAADFNRMVVDDPIRDLLQWIASPQQKRQAMGVAGWEAFAASMRSEYGFEVETAGPSTAAELLCRGEGKWAAVWRRFEQGPASFPGLYEALERIDPDTAGSSGLFEGRDVLRYPAANAKAEEEISAALEDLEELPHEQACQAVLELDAKHAVRRSSVWAAIGRARLAQALEPLAELARGAERSQSGSSPHAFVADYEQDGWKTDAALVDAVAFAEIHREPLVASAATVLAEPWLEQSAQAFQEAVRQQPLPVARDADVIEPTAGECLIFVDGLRYDQARRLADRLDGRGLKSAVASRWAALPTVTATAKPAVTPVAGEVEGGPLGDTFEPRMRGGKVANAPQLRKAIEERGGQLIGPDDLAMPASEDAWGWCEVGDIDSLGHKLNTGLAAALTRQIEAIADRIEQLLSAGWKRVRVVTDHGWLLLPGGLPKVELSKDLAPSRWARCARVTGAMPPNVVQSSWHWNAQHLVASPPGIACFNSNDGYAHGGLSVQECLIPVLTVTGDGRRTEPTARLKSVGWIKYRCHIECEHPQPGMSVDLRLGRRDGESVLAAGPKALDQDGVASAAVEDIHENKTLVVVLLDASGAVLDQRSTRIGASS